MELGAYPYANWVLVVLAVYLAGMVLVGWWASKRIKDVADYVVAGRRMGMLWIAGSLFATWFCAGTLMGATANAYLFGNQGVIFDPWGAALCLALAGFFFVRIMRRGRFITLVDFFEMRYGREMGLASTIVLIIAEIGWVGAQLVAFGTIIQIFSGLPLWVGIVISTVVLVAYTYMGGMWADTLTDIVQMLILAVGVIVMLPAAISHVGGWSSFFANAGNWAELPPFAMGPVKESGYLGYTGTLGWIYYFAAWMSIGLGSIPAQDFMQRALSSRDEKVAVYSSYIAAVGYIVIGLIPVALGMAAYIINPDLTVPETEMILPWMAMNFLPPALASIFVAAAVAALMSSGDSALLAIGSLAGYNGLRYFKPNPSEKESLWVTRIIVPIAAVASLLLALYAETIYRLMVIAWTVILVGLFAPYAAAYFWKKANRSGALAALLGGFASWLAFIFYYLPTTMEANTGVIEEGVVYMDWAIWDAVYLASVPGFVISVVLLVVVSLLTQRADPPRLLTDIDGNPLPLRDWLGIFRRNQAAERS
ncbi:MAG: sodium:solute symporter family protein [Bacillota bacterium]